MMKGEKEMATFSFTLFLKKKSKGKRDVLKK